MEKNCFGCSYNERIPLSNRYKCTKFKKTLLNYPPEPLSECDKFSNTTSETKKVEEEKIKVAHVENIIKAPEIKEEKPLSLYERRRLELEKMMNRQK